MTPVDMVVALWSCLTSLCLLLRRNPAQAFSFKYYKDRNALVSQEDPNERLEFELTDFTNDVPRRLELSTLKGVGRLGDVNQHRQSKPTPRLEAIRTAATTPSPLMAHLSVCTKALAVTKKCMGPIESPEDTLIRLPVIQRHPPSQVSNPVSHSPTTHRDRAKPDRCIFPPTTLFESDSEAT
ncbi:hypothetical protein BKA70DRAFT_1437555 [Coprinopsis sp. MPI-PUGE-AT-0042]|nr:hypothetical protein BKA70DRAFT_1437555 [Coprinopsis sp. MPI-PUGE-AT-0042]